MLQLSEYELTVATDLVDPLTLPISWKDIGGLREVIDEIKVRMNIKNTWIHILADNKIKKVHVRLNLPSVYMVWSCTFSSSVADILELCYCCFPSHRTAIGTS